MGDGDSPLKKTVGKAWPQEDDIACDKLSSRGLLLHPHVCDGRSRMSKEASDSLEKGSLRMLPGFQAGLSSGNPMYPKKSVGNMIPLVVSSTRLDGMVC